GVVNGRVIDGQLGDDANAALVRLLYETVEVLQRAVARMDGLVVRDVVPVVAQRRGIEGEQPERVDPERLQVVELPGEAGKVADAAAVAVGEGAHVRLVDDGVLVPVTITHVLSEGPARSRAPRVTAGRGARSSPRRATCRFLPREGRRPRCARRAR